MGGQYQENDLWYGGLRSRVMGSIAIPEGYYVELYNGSGGFEAGEGIGEGTEKIVLHGKYEG
jgi:hypothetical protein